MEKQLCKNCAHFRQHYALDKRRFYKVYCGHCTCLRARRKRPDSPACEHYSPGEPDQCAFVTKEYLSKELLQYLLGLELLPEMKEADT